MKDKGFTLVELMVVIAIIGVLTAVALPNLQSVINRGKIAACAGEMRNIKTSILVYADTNGNIPPGSAWASWDMRGINNNLAPYMDKPISTDPWKSNYYYNSCGYFYGWRYSAVIIALGKNKINDGTCGRCRWCCGYGVTGTRERICGDDQREMLKA